MRCSAYVCCVLVFALLAGCGKKAEPMKSKEFTVLSDDAAMKEAGNEFLVGDLHTIKQISDIPENCRLAYAGADLNNQLFMADPGEKFEPSDVITDSRLPNTRLLFAGTGQKSCFFYYEKGGRTLNYHLEIFHLGSPATLTYHGVDSKGPYRDLAALRMAVRGFAFMRMTGSERFERR